MDKGGNWEIKVREAREQGRGSGSEVLTPCFLPPHTHNHAHITATTMLTYSLHFNSLNCSKCWKMHMNIFKKGTLILIFLHDTSVPMVQSNYLNLHTVPSPSLEKQNKVNDCKFNSAIYITIQSLILLMF